VEEAGDHALARPRLASEQDGRGPAHGLLAGHDPLDLLAEPEHRGAPSQDLYRVQYGA
jgi:hypothetical protein